MQATSAGRVCRTTTRAAARQSLTAMRAARRGRFAGGSFKRATKDSADYGWSLDAPNWPHHGDLVAEQSYAGSEGVYGAWLLFGLIPAGVLVLVTVG